LAAGCRFDHTTAPFLCAPCPIRTILMHRDRHETARPWITARKLRAGLLAVAAACSGCNAWQPATYNPPVLFGGDPVIAPQTNPLVVQNMNPDQVWDQTVDVV